MKQSLKGPTVTLFVLVACGLSFFSQFAVYCIKKPLDEATLTKINLIAGDGALGKLESSRILQSHTANASIAALTLAADDENDDEDGSEDGKDNEGPDRLWDSAMLG